MAARDRFGGLGEPATTPLQRYILQACDPQNFEPNLALNLEIADLINAKKGTAPREAAISIVHYINHRNANVSMLALNLLDICVKNCGYPFHLQISTKEFLNELVRRFPERPPMHASRSQQKILELIEEWRQTICQTSRYKEDLGFIRDMHRLLSYKGYVFPQINQRDAAVLNPSDNLRSAEEMEEEEREAQSAKLQELIRRGGPQDLQEANKLMKVMAGYDTRNKTNWRAKAAEEVGKVQQKAKILEEMLQSQKPGEQLVSGDVSEELANALASAQPKIRKMCEEESDDHEAVAKLLEINDSLHRTLERYKLIKKGDVEGAAKIPKGTLGSSGAGVSRGPDNELSLIDLGGPDDEPAPSASNGTASAAAPAPKGNALEDDLLGLSLGADTYGQGGGISLGGLSNPVAPSVNQAQPPQSNIDLFGTISSSETPSFFSQSPQPQIGRQQPPKPVDPFASLSGGQPASSADPFAALKSPSSRQPSPFQFQQSISTPPPTQPAVAAALVHPSIPTSLGASAAADTSGGDDEWTFASALPDQSSELTVTNTSLHVVFNVSRQPDSHILISTKFSNNTAQPVSELTFQVAVTKNLQLRLEPQTSRNLAPNQINGITQVIRLYGVENGKASTVKMRWRCSYLLGGTRREEGGEVVGLGTD